MAEPAPDPARGLSASLVRQVRVVGMVEGASFLLLLGIAMPLKYLAGLPQAVRVVGMIHGLLFVVYVAAAVHAGWSLGWRLSRTLLVLGAAVFPAGPFLIDGWLRRLERAP
jgi:integral membrane protein